VFPGTAFETTLTKILGGMATKIGWHVKYALKRQLLEIVR
jgi:hypothetical protein